MRKLKSTLAAFVACVMLTGCANGSDSSSESSTVTEKTAAERTADALNELELPEMAEVTPEKLETYFSIDPADVIEFSAYVAGAGVYPDRLGVFVAVDANAAQRISEALKKYNDEQKATYADYAPDEVYKFDDAVVSIQGSEVIYAVCGDNYSAEKLLQ